MNWLDISLLVLLGMAAFKGYQRGLLIELASLVGLVLGIWAGLRFNRAVADWLGFEEHQEALGFIVILLAVLALLHLAARVCTKAMDLTGLGLPNKAAGALSGLLRALFVLSAMINVLSAVGDRLPEPMYNTLKDSGIATGIQELAPMVVPELADGKWLRSGFERIREQTDEVL
ncbi:MAG: CvpA family protein [Flavobacteriales bacterium]|nr:MAG: CvpA family protein [Flavobacteriales bacterium]